MEKFPLEEVLGGYGDNGSQNGATEIVCATVGHGHGSIVRDIAGYLPEFSEDLRADWYFQRVVEDTQQHFHDAYVDTDWPRCPLHGRHPLWLHDGGWWCEQAGKLIAPVGGLGEKTETAQR